MERFLLFLLGVALLAGCASPGPPSEVPGPRPTLDLVSGHPRLLATAADLERLRDQLESTPAFQEAWEKLCRQTTQALREPIPVPRKKGGMQFDYFCPEDLTRLLYEWNRPHQHRCPRCSREYSGEAYDGAWRAWAHARLSRRVRDFGIVYAVAGDESFAEAARNILLEYATLYFEFPIRDQHLGPARVFPHTLSEVHWTIALAQGYDLIWNAPNWTDEERQQLENLFRSAAQVIDRFDEGISNRQCWYNAGVGTVGNLLEDAERIRASLAGGSRFDDILRFGLPRGGLWYEGTGYHFYTLSALTTHAEMIRSAGYDLYRHAPHGVSLRDMFAAPLRIAFPDGTLLKNKDNSRPSLLNPGTLAAYELAAARFEQPGVLRLLQRAYSEAGIDRARVLLGYGSLPFFHALDRIPPPSEAITDSETDPCHWGFALADTGPAVLRKSYPDHPLMAVLDVGWWGGGHGHADRLNLSFFADQTLWFADPGNGSYGWKLHGDWYRTSLAHNTVTVDHASHQRSNTRLDRFVESPYFSLAVGTVEDAYPDVELQRALILTPYYLVDLFAVRSPNVHTYDFSLSGLGRFELLSPDPAFTDIEFPPQVRGYMCLRNGKAMPLDCVFSGRYLHGEKSLCVWGTMDGEGLLLQAEAPGRPTTVDEPLPLVVLQRQATSTLFVMVYFAPAPSDDRELSFAHDELCIRSSGHQDSIQFDPGDLARIACHSGYKFEHSWLASGIGPDFSGGVRSSPAVDWAWQHEFAGESALRTSKPVVELGSHYLGGGDVYIDGNAPAGAVLFDFGSASFDVFPGHRFERTGRILGGGAAWFILEEARGRIEPAPDWEIEFARHQRFWGGLTIFGDEASPSNSRKASADWLSYLTVHTRRPAPGERVPTIRLSGDLPPDIFPGPYHARMTIAGETRDLVFHVREPVELEMKPSWLPDGGTALLATVRNPMSSSTMVELKLEAPWLAKDGFFIFHMIFDAGQQVSVAVPCEWRPENFASGHLLQWRVRVGNWTDWGKERLRVYQVPAYPAESKEELPWDEFTPIHLGGDLPPAWERWREPDEILPVAVAEVRMAQAEESLVLRADVTDPTFAIGPEKHQLFDHDSIEVWMELRGAPWARSHVWQQGHFRHLLIPGLPLSNEELLDRATLIWFRQNEEASQESVRDETGYCLYYCVPLTMLQGVEEPGIIPFNVGLRDNQGGHKIDRISLWEGKGFEWIPWRNAAREGWLVLEKP